MGGEGGDKCWGGRNSGKHILVANPSFNLDLPLPPWLCPGRSGALPHRGRGLAPGAPAEGVITVLPNHSPTLARQIPLLGNEDAKGGAECADLHTHPHSSIFQSSIGF